MKFRILLSGVGLLSTLLTGCGDRAEKTGTTEDDTSVSASGAVDAMQEMAKQAEEMQKKGPVETVDFRKLKEMLPTDADGLDRKEATGEKSGMAGFAFSTAKAEYASADGSQRIELSIVDAGGSGALMGLAAWSMVEVDKETENGYEKTTKYGDYKAYEKYDNGSRDGELAVIVKNRFVVSAKGSGVDMSQIKATLDEIDLDKLSELK